LGAAGRSWAAARGRVCWVTSGLCVQCGGWSAVIVAGWMLPRICLVRCEGCVRPGPESEARGGNVGCASGSERNSINWGNVVRIRRLDPVDCEERREKEREQEASRWSGDEGLSCHAEDGVERGCRGFRLCCVDRSTSHPVQCWMGHHSFSDNTIPATPLAPLSMRQCHPATSHPRPALPCTHASSHTLACMRRRNCTRTIVQPQRAEQPARQGGPPNPPLSSTSTLPDLISPLIARRFPRTRLAGHHVNTNTRVSSTGIQRHCPPHRHMTAACTRLP
jgi:hypothetical protein